MPITRIWNPVATLKGHNNTIWSCAWSPDSRWIASASNDRTLRIWDAKLWREKAVLRAPDNLNCCAWSPDGRWIAAGSHDNTLRIWDAKTLIDGGALKGHTSRVWTCAWSRNSRWIASGAGDCTLRLWDMKTGIEVSVLKGHKDAIYGCAWSPDNCWIVTASADKTLIIWNAKKLIKVATLEWHINSVSACAWSPDNSRIVSASWDGTLKVWSWNGKNIATLRGHESNVNGCAWSPDSRWIVSASHDATLKIWDVKTWKEAASLEGIVKGSVSCAWSPDSRWIVSTSQDHTLKVWEASAITKALLPDDLIQSLRELARDGGVDNKKTIPGYPFKITPAPQSGSSEIPINIIDRVHLTVTSPPAVRPGESFVIYIWAHLERQRQEVIERARSSSGGIEVGSKGPVQVARGTVLSVRMSVEGLINNQQDTILWDGEIGNANFLASVADDAREGPRIGLALIYANELQIARINFVIHVGKLSLNAAPLTTQEQRHRKAFASYSSADRDDVLARIQGMLKAAPELEVFLDVHSLRSGQYWEQELFKVIPVNDIFYLFWSESAKKSEWVEKEWRCALKTKGLDFIDPVPLVSPHEVPPPSELADKHFNDWVLAFMRTKGPKA